MVDRLRPERIQLTIQFDIRADQPLSPAIEHPSRDSITFERLIRSDPISVMSAVRGANRRHSGRIIRLGRHPSRNTCGSTAASSAFGSRGSMCASAGIASRFPPRRLAIGSRRARKRRRTAAGPPFAASVRPRSRRLHRTVTWPLMPRRLYRFMALTTTWAVQAPPTLDCGRCPICPKCRSALDLHSSTIRLPHPPR